MNIDEKEIAEHLIDVDYEEIKIQQKVKKCQRITICELVFCLLFF